ncbi:MAG: RNA polymerase sigma factor (sigma-70 family) [Cyclobacteriaceae bacterium]|jgi:RNA polymerase sigma factor (sigma-70 family)
MKTSSEVSLLIDHFFRNESGKAIAFLTNRFGTENLEFVEDAVQEALFKAMQTWPYKTVPNNPTSWIIRVAGNKLVDQLRRNKKITYTEEIIDDRFEEVNLADGAFKDDMIRMIFACCNPQLSDEYQLILTLKILGGLSVKEIASGLLKKEETVAKSYTRAKKKFREENLTLELPESVAIDERLLRVLKVIYLLFNEGYKSTDSDQLIRKDLCKDAIRLCQLLLENRLTNTPYTRSLLALMYYHSSRFDARINQDGEIIPLEKQDRANWKKDFINRGNYYLSSVTENETQNEYFLQAAISGIHCNADTYEETRWDIILHLYDTLYHFNPSPIVALNRIVALEKIKGSAEALTEIEKLEKESSLTKNYLLPAIKAEIYISLKQIDQAIKSIKKAISLTANPNEKEYLKKKMSTFDRKKPTLK